MKKLILFLILLTCFSSLHAQNPFAWQYCYGTAHGYENASSMIPVRAGGYLMGGTQSDSVAYRTYFVRTDANGIVLWEKTYEFGVMAPGSMCEDSLGNFMVVGFKTLGGTPIEHDAYLLKLNPQGDTLWTKEYNGPISETLNIIKLANDQNFIVTGHLDSIGTILKIDGDGNTIWQKSYMYNDTLNYGFVGIEPVSSGYLAFQYGGYLGLPHKVLLLDENGDSIHTRPNPLFPNRTIRTSTGAVLQANYHGLAKTTAQGDTVWIKKYNIWSSLRGIKAVAETQDGNYIGLVEFNNGNDYDFALVLTDSNGNKLKDTVLLRYGPQEYARDIAIAPNGDYVIFGTTTSGLIGWGDFVLAQFKKWNITTGPPNDEQNSLAAGAILAVYPNPAHNKVNVKLAGNLTGQLQLLSLHGQLLQSKHIANQAEAGFDLAAYPAGMYMLRYLGGNGTAQAQKLIKY